MELHRIVVYCGTSSTRDPAVETEIRSFGREIARRGITLVYGGSSLGLMGVLADEVLASGGKVVGVIPRALVGREAAHTGLTELRVVETMHDREQAMFDLGDAFVAFPGGFGTLEELLEMVTWKQLGIHGKPVVIANIGGYFDPLLQQLEKAIRLGYARAENRILYGIADTTKAILTFLEGAPVLERKPGNWA
ncbi:MAG TPA: TIGR00730 family Rossman fold protein [Thermoanaerobaculia bacterium]|nr:TIGR00730 family Rossman fold protein [Thermoanaerobaculia bacterium]